VSSKTVTFQDFLQESFAEGILVRELRLSAEEIAIVKEIYPQARITEMPGGSCSDGKVWVKVCLAESI